MLTRRFVIAALAAALIAAVPAAAPAHPGDAVAAAKKKKKKKKKKPPATVPIPPGDADGDGLPNSWEAQPKTVQAKKKKKKKKKKKGRSLAVASATAPPELWKFGASMNRKDVFVELDYNGTAIKDMVPCVELDKLVTAFANGPVSNPDGSQGVTLHLDAGKTCPSRSYDLGGSQFFNAGGACPSQSAVFNAIGQLDHPGRIGSFHYAAISDSCGGAAGAATSPGITMAVFTSGSDMSNVFMHELGHNLGLNHNFSDAMGAQPNRLSVMSNQLQLGDSANGPFTQTPDFQRFTTPELDESAMNEEAGLGTAAAHRYIVFYRCPVGTTTNPTGPGTSGFNWWPGDQVDWNCSSPPIVVPPSTGDIQSGTVAADINADGDTTDVYPAVTEEWTTLDYGGGGAIGKLP